MTSSTSTSTTNSANTPQGSNTSTSSSASSKGFFRQVDAFLRGHPTLANNMKAAYAALPVWVKSPGFAFSCMLLAYFGFFGWSVVICKLSAGLLEFEPVVWTVEMLGDLTLALETVSRWITFVVLLPFRAFLAVLVGSSMSFFLSFPFLVAAGALLPLCAYCTFGAIFPDFPPFLIRLLDYLSLPVLFHWLTSYFSLSVFAPYTAYFPFLYFFLTLTALFNLSPLRFVVRVLARAEDAIRALAEEPAMTEARKEEGADKVEELQGELQRLMEEVERLKGKKEI